MLINSLRALLSVLPLVVGVAVSTAAFAQENPEPKPPYGPKLECRVPLQQLGYWKGHRATAHLLTKATISQFSSLLGETYANAPGYEKRFVDKRDSRGGVLVGYLDCGTIPTVIDKNRWITVFYLDPANESQTKLLLDKQNMVFYAYDLLTKLPISDGKTANDKLHKAWVYTQR